MTQIRLRFHAPPAAGPGGGDALGSNGTHAPRPYHQGFALSAADSKRGAGAAGGSVHPPLLVANGDAVTPLPAAAVGTQLARGSHPARNDVADAFSLL